MYVQLQVEIDLEARKLKMFGFSFSLGGFICISCKAVDFGAIIWGSDFAHVVLGNFNNIPTTATYFAEFEGVKVQLCER
jgi:hypothetical protein